MKSVLAALAVALTIALGHRQLLQPVALTTRDHIDSYLRTHQYVRELADGHWPQTLPDAVRGGGHAFPRFYPPLSQWSAVGLYALTSDPVSATHLAGLASIVLAGLACFAALRLLGTSLLPSAFAGALYALLPYTWTALDIRGAFAETWALVFHPLVLAGIVLSLRRGHPVRWLPWAVAGSLGSHLVMAAWALPVLSVTALFAVWPDVRWSGVWRTAVAGPLGAGMMALFILPALFDLKGLRASDPVLMWATPEKLAGVSWPFYESTFRTFPYWNQIEWGLLALGTLGMWQARRDPGLTRRLCWAGLAGYAALAILARAPVEVWRLVPQQLRYIQFPERLLGLAGLCFALTLASATSLFRTRLGTAVTVGLGAMVLLLAFHLGRQTLPRTGERGDEILGKLRTEYPDRGLTVVGEYLPLGTEPEVLAAHIQHIRDQVGTAPLMTWERERDGYRAVVKLDASGEVLLPLVSYGFYRVRSDEGPVAAVSPAGLLTVRLGPGTHQLSIGRRWPLSSKLGLVLSLLSLAASPWVGRRLHPGSGTGGNSTGSTS